MISETFGAAAAGASLVFSIGMIIWQNRQFRQINQKLDRIADLLVQWADERQQALAYREQMAMQRLSRGVTLEAVLSTQSEGASYSVVSVQLRHS